MEPQHASFLAAAAGMELGQWIASTFGMHVGMQRPPPATGEEAARQTQRELEELRRLEAETLWLRGAGTARDEGDDEK